MIFACISDIHGMWSRPEYPKADVLLIAGDVLSNYSYDRNLDAARQLGELEKLNEFFGSLKSNGTYSHIVFGAGNHDFCFERLNHGARSLLTNVTYLQDNYTVIDGIKVYVSPFQSWFYDWAFNLPKNDESKGYPAAKKLWSGIPEDTNVLVIHGPARDILDLCPDGRRVGCPILRERLKDLKQLKLFVTGHIHQSYGKQVVDGITCINASLCDENYSPINPIQVVEI